MSGRREPDGGNSDMFPSDTGNVKIGHLQSRIDFLVKEKERLENEKLNLEDEVRCQKEKLTQLETQRMREINKHRENILQLNNEKKSLEEQLAQLETVTPLANSSTVAIQSTAMENLPAFRPPGHLSLYIQQLKDMITRLAKKVYEQQKMITVLKEEAERWTPSGEPLSTGALRQSAGSDPQSLSASQQTSHLTLSSALVTLKPSSLVRETSKTHQIEPMDVSTENSQNLALSTTHGDSGHELNLTALKGVSFNQSNTPQEQSDHVYQNTLKVSRLSDRANGAIPKVYKNSNTRLSPPPPPPTRQPPAPEDNFVMVDNPKYFKDNGYMSASQSSNSVSEPNRGPEHPTSHNKLPATDIRPMQGSEVAASETNDKFHVCPTCNETFRTSGEVYYSHVLSCADKMFDDVVPETVSSSTQQQPGVDFNAKTCPVCDAKFDTSIPQKAFEDHVYGHFMDEDMRDDTIIIDK